MAVPIITRVYPADNDTGIPINAVLEIDFDRGVDEETVKRYVVLYGADFDQTSGPNSALWVDDRTGDNPYFLRSPGFTGIVDVDYSFIYLDSLGVEISNPELLDEAAETLAGYAMRVKLIPKKPLAPDVVYYLHIVGDPDSEDVGISSRIVWSTIPDPGNTSTTGFVYAYGAEGYAGGDDVLRIEITTSGEISAAKYSWQWTSEGVQAGQTGKLASRRYRYIDEEQGVQVRFGGSGFISGDIYDTTYESAERLATTTRVTFTTGDGTYTAAPESASTPASSSPPSSAIPSSTVASEDAFYVVAMTPGDRSYHVDIKTRQIIIEFSEDINAATITDDTVTLTVYPALGERENYSKRELSKKLTVDDNLLIIDF